jgi:hypothetical protein
LSVFGCPWQTLEFGQLDLELLVAKKKKEKTSVQPSRGGRMIQKLGYLFTVIHLHTGADKRMFRSNCYTRLMYPINGPKTEDNNLSVKSTEKSKTQLRPNHSE